MISEAQALSETSDENLSLLTGISVEKLGTIKSGETPIDSDLSEVLICALEKRGCYFTFDSGACRSAHLFSFADSRPRDSSPLELSKIYAIDARSFARNAAVLDEHRSIEDEEIFLHLPLLFLCGHSIELALKSFILKTANDHAAILKPQKNRRTKTHDLIWLLDQCRRLGCEKIIDISDIEYLRVKILSEIHGSYSNRFREGQAPPEGLSRKSLLNITQKMCRYSEPPIFIRDRLIKNGRGPIVLNFRVPARPTPKKPPIRY